MTTETAHCDHCNTDLTAEQEASRLVRGEAVEVLEREVFTVRRQDGSTLEVAGLPDGYWVGDYFRAGVYLGPDVDGVEPTWMPAHEGKAEMTTTTEIATIRAHWDTTDASNPGWYVECLAVDGEVLTDSMKVDFPVAADAYDRDERDGLAANLRSEFPGATVEVR